MGHEQLVITLGFDYGELDTETRIVVQQEDKEFDRNMQDAGSSFVDACKNVQRIHAVLKYKRPGFDDWCETKQGLSRRTAYRMLDVAKMCADSAHIISAPKEALYLLAAPSTSDDARQAAVELTRNGEVISYGRAQEIVNGSRPRIGRVCPYCGRQYEGDGSEVTACPDCGELHIYSGPRDVAKYGPTAVHAERVVNEFAAPPPPVVHFSSQSDEHNTPQEIIDAALDCMGEIDLDPCSNSHDAPNVPARILFTKDEDGLTQEWRGRVYMNPPYGREIGRWIDKMCQEHKAGKVSQAIALIPARTDTQWWDGLRDFPICFIKGRLVFGGNENSAPFPSAAVYLGENIDRFYYAFCDLGDIWQRIEPGMFGE